MLLNTERTLTMGSLPLSSPPSSSPSDRLPPSSPPPVRLPRRSGVGGMRVWIAVLVGCSTLMLLLGLSQQGVLGVGLLGWLKLGVIGVAAFVVSHLIYRLAIEKGATLGARGYPGAVVLAYASVIVVGAAFFMATLPGLIIPSVEHTRLEAYVSDVVAYRDGRVAVSSASAGLVSLVQGLAEDAAAKAACEAATSCVSNQGEGGYGAVARALETHALRARTVADVALRGADARDVARAAVSAHITQMQAVVADEAVNIWDRRVDLRRLDHALGDVLTTLDEALPVSTIAAYAAELEAGAAAPGAVGDVLAGYAVTVRTALDEQSNATPERPTFPKRTGTLEALAYAGDYLSLAVLTFVMDLLMPLALLTYTIWVLHWTSYVARPDPEWGQRKRDTFDHLMGLEPMDLAAHDQRLAETKDTPPTPPASPQVVPDSTALSDMPPVETPVAHHSANGGGNGFGNGAAESRMDTPAPHPPPRDHPGRRKR